LPSTAKEAKAIIDLVPDPKLRMVKTGMEATLDAALEIQSDSGKSSPTSATHSNGKKNKNQPFYWAAFQLQGEWN